MKKGAPEFSSSWGDKWSCSRGAFWEGRSGFTAASLHLRAPAKRQSESSEETSLSSPLHQSRHRLLLEYEPSWVRRSITSQRTKTPSPALIYQQGRMATAGEKRRSICSLTPTDPHWSCRAGEKTCWWGAVRGPLRALIEAPNFRIYPKLNLNIELVQQKFLSSLFNERNLNLTADRKCFNISEPLKPSW